ncbi:MAG: hypothetical protein AB7V32_07850 [Candidatus Berkiella sp.]
MTMPDALKQFIFPNLIFKSTIKTYFKYLFFIMAFAFLANFMVQANAMLRSASVTPTIGFIFTPLITTVSSIQVWIFAVASAYVLGVIHAKSPKLNVFFLLCLIVTIRLIWVFGEQVMDVMNTKFAIYEINLLQKPDNIEEKFNAYQSFPRAYQAYILEAIALNPFTSQEILAKIAKIDGAIVESKLDSLFYYQVDNEKRMSVKTLVARNPNTSKETLEALSVDVNLDVQKEAKASLAKKSAKP